MSATKKRQWTAEELTHPDLGDLPADWEWSTIGDEITELKGGLGTKKSDYIDSGILLFNKGNVTTDGRTAFDGKRKYVSEEFFAKHQKHAVQPGNLVVTLRDLSVKADFLGLVGTYRQPEPALLSQGACVVETGASLLPPFLAYYSNSPFYRTTAKANKNGTTQVHLRNGQFGAIPIPLPPLPEQRRIVARIEELFSRLDAGVAALRHAKAQLQRYRQSVLAAAVTGQLTQAWREQHPDTEPAEELLERIVEQRRSEWDERGKFKEPVEVEQDAFGSLPVTWTATTISALGVVKGGKRLPKGSTYAEFTTDYPYLRVVDFDGFSIRRYDLRYLDEDVQQQIERYTISSDDVYISIAGTIGMVGTIPDDLDGANLTENAAKITGLVETSERFLCYWLASSPCRDFITCRTKTTTQPKLALYRIEQIPVPLPPLAEQHQIVAEVEARTTAIDHLEAELDRQITRSNILRKSILSSAFKGRI